MNDRMRDGQSIEVDNVAKSFGTTQVLRGVQLRANQGEVVALLGPSGCGKTTLLRLLAGLERPDLGRIVLGGEVVAGGPRFVAPERRGVGFVFQDYALFPQRTVNDNVAFGLRRTPRAERTARVEAVLAQVDLVGLGARYPHELSGGQQQRVALARALAPQPRVLLLDEPFSNLDASLRRRLRLELGSLLRELRITTVFVTHDQDEALSLADRVAVMANGRIAQIGTAQEVYEQPQTVAVALAVGEVNFVPGTADNGQVQTALGTLPGVGPDGSVQVLLRPEHLEICLPEQGPGVLVGVVRACEYLGREVHMLVDVAGGDAPLAVRCEATSRVTAGDAVGVRCRTKDGGCWFSG